MTDPQPGDIFHRGQVLNNTYEIEAVLGRGGTGEVYRARNLISDRIVAIKALNSQFSGREDYVQLMRREEQMRDILHDAVVRYTECSRTDDGHVFVVMDFIDGPSMQALLERGGMDARELLIVAHRVTEGLVAAHGHGIVHRDLSPDNVILRDGRPERATIIDFGIAKDTAAGARTIVGNEFAGKYEYAAPEQLEGRAEPRSDLYALGALLLAAFRGRLPFAGATPGEIVRRKQRPLETDGVPEPLKGLIEWLSAPEPAARPADAGAVLARLDGLLVPKHRKEPQPVRRRGRALWLALPVIAVAAVGGAWYAGLFGPPAPPPLPVAAPYLLTASVEGGVGRLSGNAPDPAAAAAIAAAFAEATGVVPPEGSLTLADGVPSATWAAGVAALLGALDGAEGWTLEVRDGLASVTGVAPDRAARDAVSGRLGTAAGAGGLQLATALRAGPAVLAADTVAAIAAGAADCGPLATDRPAGDSYAIDETVTLTGRVASQATADALTAAVTAAAGDRPVRVEVTALNPPICTVQLALPPTPQDGLSIWLGQGATGAANPTGVFNPGDNPIAELHLPADRAEGYLWVAVVDTTGNVFNLLPNLNQPEHALAAVGTVGAGLRRVRLLHTLEEFAADNSRLAMRVTESDFGKSEIVAFLTRRPLFELRPKTESAAAFAEALTEAVAADPDNIRAIATRVLDSRP
jgi:hypothetical protein